MIGGRGREDWRVMRSRLEDGGREDGEFREFLVICGDCGERREFPP